MPQSMTGFAVADAAAHPFRLSWEIRSVNHRYLDLSFRLPDELRRLEKPCREYVAGEIKRGKVDCALRVATANDGVESTDIDIAALLALDTLEQKVRESIPNAAPLAVSDILRWPGIVREPQKDFDALEEPVLECLAEAVGMLQSARRVEGERIAEFIAQRSQSIDAVISAAKPLLRASETRYRDKLIERIERLGIDADAQRIEQELAIIAQRLDVSEEVDRLESHLQEVSAVLGRDEPMGRRLDFLIQELNREANTLTSKSQDDDLTRHAVELKVLIEQMREQVQNLE